MKSWVSIECVICGHEHFMLVDEADLLAWQNGKLAQDAFPYLSADEREMLISGICPACWDRMFGGEDK